MPIYAHLQSLKIRYNGKVYRVAENIKHISLH